VGARIEQSADGTGDVETELRVEDLGDDDPCVREQQRPTMGELGAVRAGKNDIGGSRG
jgi:hypothetical protein